MPHGAVVTRVDAESLARCALCLFREDLRDVQREFEQPASSRPYRSLGDDTVALLDEPADCDVFDMRDGKIRRLVSYLMQTPL